MSDWFTKLRAKFERKNNDLFVKENSQSVANFGVVKRRKQHFERLNSLSADTRKFSALQKDRRIVTDFRSLSPESSGRSEDERNVPNINGNDQIKTNIHLTPACVANEDDVCVYHSESPTVAYGSFKRRPVFLNPEYYVSSDNDVIMRMKQEEREYNKIQRYHSILKPALMQQILLAKHNSFVLNNNSDNEPALNIHKKNSVSEIINLFSNVDNNELLTEAQIDRDLLKSLKRIDINMETRHDIIPETRNPKWIEMEQVISLSTLNTLTADEIKFQESQFEVITSEASYYRSLTVLIDVFYNSPFLSLIREESCNGTVVEPVIKAHQKEHLFSNILKIHAVSSRFLSELEQRFMKSPIIDNLCDIVQCFAETEFRIYVPYIQNQKFQTTAYQELKRTEAALKVIEELENKPECCSMTLDSFLLLPMQRLLRIRLLMIAVQKHLPAERKAIENDVTRTIEALDLVIGQCSSEKDRMDERQRMLEICRCLRFKVGQGKLSITNGKLIHEGDVRRSRRNMLKSTFPELFNFSTVYWFILTDEYLLMTKMKKGKEVVYNVDEVCRLSDIKLEQYEQNTERFKLIIRKSEDSGYFFIIQAKSKKDYRTWWGYLATYCSK